MAYIGKAPLNGFHAKQSLTGDGSTVTFTLDFQVANETAIIVSVGGVIQEPSEAYNLSIGGTKIVFTEAPTSTDRVYIQFLGQAIVQNVVDVNGGEFVLDADADTSFTADTDDEIDIKVGGSDRSTIKATGFHNLDNIKFVAGTGDDMQMYHDGTNSYLTNSEGALKIATETSSIAVTIGHTTSEVTIADNATVAGNLTVTGTLTQTGSQTFDGGIDVDNFNINGTTIALSSGDMTLDSAGDIILDADGGDVFFKDAGTTFGSATNTSGNLIIKSGTTTALTFSGANVTAAGTITGNLTGNVTGNVTGNASGTALTVTQAAQSAITSLGTLTALTVDDVAIDGKVMTMTGSSGDTFVTTVGTNGATSLVTVDTAAAAAHLTITADGTVDINSAGVLTLDSGAAINIEPASGSAILLDGTISIDAGVVTGATSITSTAFVGDITGDVTGNADTATALATARTIGGTSFDGSANIAVGLATLATTVTITDNESTDENNAIVFTAGGDVDGGNLGLESDGDLTYNPSSGTLNVPNISVTGTQTIVNSVTMNASNAVIFEGATADAHETTLSTVDATADRTINLPNQSGTLPVLAAASATAITSTPEELNKLDGATVTVGEINLIDGDATVGTTAFADGDGLLHNDNGTMRVTSATTLKTYMSDLTLTTAAQGNVTSLGTLTALTVDDVAVDGKVITMTGSSGDTFVTTVAANGATSLVTTDASAAAANLTITADGTVTIASTGDLTLDSSTDIVLDAGGADILLKDDGTSWGQLINSSGLRIHSNVSDSDITFTGNDGGSVITAMTLDMSDAGKAIFTGIIHTDANIDLSDSSGASDGRITLGDSNDLQIYHDGSHSYIYEQGTGDLYLRGTEIRIKSGGDNDDMATFIENGAATLFYQMLLNSNLKYWCYCNRCCISR